MHFRLSSWAIIVLTFAATLAACKSHNSSQCSLTSPNCTTGVCYPDGNGHATCTPSCDITASTTSCAMGTVCLASSSTNAVCADTCNLATPSCGTGRTCFPVGGGAGACAASCDPAAASPACSPGQMCLAVTGGGVCVPTCDGPNSTACGAVLTCDPIAGGSTYGCFRPVVLEGQVVDAVTGLPVAGAIVFAANDIGYVVTTAATTDASGNYTLTVPVARDATGAPVSTTFTIRASADGYQAFPTAPRPALPVSTTAATYDDTAGHYAISNALTHVGLLQLPPAQQNLAAISGVVGGTNPAGALVVAECATAPCPFAYADSAGKFTIFNVPDGSYTIRVFKVGLQITPTPVTVTAATDVTGLSLTVSANPLVTVNGSITAVQGAGPTSIVLMPASTFASVPYTTTDGIVLNNLILRGEVAPGLRAPDPGTAPNITSAYTIANVPEGDYTIIAGLENDDVTRDPDPNHAGTAIVTIHIPADVTPGTNTLTVGTSFKTIPSITMVSPGLTTPDPITFGTNPTFTWVDTAQEDHYNLVVLDAFGTQVWSSYGAKNTSTLTYGALGGTPAIAPALATGMYYQWRLIAISNLNNPIQVTEDLRGVFYVTP